MSLDILEEIIKIAAAAGNVPVCAVGGTGIGKTTLVTALQKKYGAPVVVFRPDQVPAEDIQGIPYKAPCGERFLYLKPWWWPTAPAPEVSYQIAGVPGIITTRLGVICIDEFNRARDDRRQALFQLLSERRIGSHELPEGWQVVLCMNPDTAEYNVHPLDKATRGRCMFIPVSFSVDGWLKWAGEQTFVPDYASRFIQESGLPFEAADIREYPVPQPRTFEWLCRIATVIGHEHPLLRTCANGLLGYEHAGLFMEYAVQGHSTGISFSEWRTLDVAMLKEFARKFHQAGSAEKASRTLDNVLDGIKQLPEKDGVKEAEKLLHFLLESPRDIIAARMEDIAALGSCRRAIFSNKAFHKAWGGIFENISAATSSA